MGRVAGDDAGRAHQSAARSCAHCAHVVVDADRAHVVVYTIGSALRTCTEHTGHQIEQDEKVHSRPERGAAQARSAARRAWRVGLGGAPAYDGAATRSALRVGQLAFAPCPLNR